MPRTPIRNQRIVFLLMHEALQLFSHVHFLIVAFQCIEGEWLQTVIHLLKPNAQSNRDRCHDDDEEETMCETIQHEWEWHGEDWDLTAQRDLNQTSNNARAKSRQQTTNTSTNIWVNELSCCSPIIRTCLTRTRAHELIIFPCVFHAFQRTTASCNSDDVDTNEWIGEGKKFQRAIAVANQSYD